MQWKISDFWGKTGFVISWMVGDKEQRRKTKPIEADLKEIAQELSTTVELLRRRDRRWEISGKRANAVVILVRNREHTVSEVAKFLKRDQANISMMLLRASARDHNQL